MGNFYTNFTIKGAAPQEVARALKGRNAAVTGLKADCVVVFDEYADTDSIENLDALGQSLSDASHCPVLAIRNHDDDILWYRLYRSGAMVDAYDSNPGYFERGEQREGPKGGDSALLCATFGSPLIQEVESILRASNDDERFVFAFERHLALVTALGISDLGVCAGYEHLDSGPRPEGLEEDSLIRTR
jgi:hypothetical protein